MQSHIDYITLGVLDVAAERRFYEDGLGWQVQADRGEFVRFEPSPGSSAIALYPRPKLASDAGLTAVGGDGYSGVTFTHLVDADTDVDAVLTQASAAGGAVLQPGQPAAWGGYFGYFADPDGYLWKVVVRQELD